MLKSKPKEKKQTTNPIYAILDEITYRKGDLDFDNPEVLKSYDPYMINRWLSMVDVFLPFINDTVNRYDMDKVSHFNFLKNSLPKQKIARWNYIKKSKEISSDDVKYIADYFSVGLREAELYVSILSQEIIDKVLNTYRYGKNKMIIV